MANRRSRMRRISSRPVFRCSGFSRRTHEARSVHCSRVSSAHRKPGSTVKTRLEHRVETRPDHRAETRPESRAQTRRESRTQSREHRRVQAEQNLTQQDLQSIGMQIQGLCLLFHYIHLLCLLVIVAIDTGVGQHLQTQSRGQWAHVACRCSDDEEGDEGDTFRACARTLQASMTKVSDFICRASLMDDTLFSRLMAKSYDRKQIFSLHHCDITKHHCDVIY